MKFGIIGTSWITDAFIEAATITETAQLTNVYSRSESNAKEFAAKYGTQHVHTSIDEMLASAIDFVYIASPNVLHYEQVLQSIRARKHIFCEKPLVYTESQWEEIAREAKENDVFVFEGYRHLFAPNHLAVKKHLSKLGQVRSAILHHIQYSSRYDAFKAGDQPNVFTRDFAGGALMDLGVYPLSFALDVFGEPMDIEYFPILLSNGIDGGGTLVLLYEACTITIAISKISQATIPSEIHGEKATITMDHVAPIQSLTLMNHRQDEKIDITEEQHEVDMIYQMKAFAKMIQEKDVTKHDEWLERSRIIVKWSEKARRKAGILFPSEEA